MDKPRPKNPPPTLPLTGFGFTARAAADVRGVVVWRKKGGRLVLTTPRG